MSEKSQRKDAIQSPKSLGRSLKQLPFDLQVYRTMSPEMRQQYFDGRADTPTASSASSFDDAYARYRKILPPAYNQQVDQESQRFVKQLGDIKPDVWVCMPTRRERNTTEAVEALLNMYQKLGLKPAVVVFHNYTEEPLDETRQDLTRLEEKHDPHVFIVERNIPSTEGMGDIRGFTTDIALSAAAAISPKLDPIIATTDADITEYENVESLRGKIKSLKGGKLDAFSIATYPDLHVYAHNSELFLEQLITQSLLRQGLQFLYEKTMPDLGGRGTFIRGSVLCAIGSYPPIAYGEDLALTEGIARLRGSRNTIDFLPDVVVYANNAKEASAVNSTAHYTRWEAQREQPKPDSTKEYRYVHPKHLQEMIIERYNFIRAEIRANQGLRRTDSQADMAIYNLNVTFLQLADIVSHIEEGTYVPDVENLIQNIFRRPYIKKVGIDEQYSKMGQVSAKLK